MDKVVSRCSNTDRCCTVDVDCPVCTAPRIKKKRIRREIRTLDAETISKVVAAIKALKAQKSGKNYDYFVSKQMAAYYDSRGSQADFGAHFSTWHAMLLLEFEMEILKIDSSIKALPYWDWTDGSSSVFADEYFGALIGRGIRGSMITGPFKEFAVGTTSNETWSKHIAPNYTTLSASVPVDAPASRINFYGTTVSGKLRNVRNVNTNAFLTRPGSCKRTGRIAHRCIKYNATNILFGGSRMDCTGRINFPMVAWQSCMEGGNAVLLNPPWNNISLIRTPLQYVGATTNCSDFCTTPDPTTYALRSAGDLYDPAAGANDPVFWFHMANIDRLKQMWMDNNTDAETYYFGYPKYGARWNVENQTFDLLDAAAYQGLGLEEEISHHFGFRDADVGIIAHPDEPDKLWTHADALCWLQPRASPYLYDSLLPPPDGIPPGTPVISAATAQLVMTIAVVLMISILGTLEIYRWQYIKADKVRYAPVSTNMAAAQDDGEE